MKKMGVRGNKMREKKMRENKTHAKISWTKVIHWSFFLTALPHRLPFLFLALPFFALACFLALPNSLPCLFPWPAHAYFLLPMPYSFAYFLCLLPVSLPCLLLCPACFLAPPFSLPCLLPCPTYRSTFFYECILHGYI